MQFESRTFHFRTKVDVMLSLSGSGHSRIQPIGQIRSQSCSFPHMKGTYHSARESRQSHSDSHLLPGSAALAAFVTRCLGRQMWMAGMMIGVIRGTLWRLPDGTGSAPGKQLACSNLTLETSGLDNCLP